MPIWDHITELIKRMKVVIITFIVSTLVALAVPIDLSFLKNTAFYRTPATWLLGLINEYERPKQLILISGEITAPLELWVIAACLMGAIVTAPVFAFELYRFIDPALYPDERKAVYPVITAFTVLFLTGLLFGWFVLIPFMFWGLLPFFGFVDAQPVIFVMDFYTLVLIFLANNRDLVHPAGVLRSAREVPHTSYFDNHQAQEVLLRCALHSGRFDHA